MTEDDTYAALKYPPQHYRIDFAPLGHHRTLMECSVKTIIEGQGYTFMEDNSWEGIRNENWLDTLLKIKSLRNWFISAYHITPFVIIDAKE
jgi:hypothetical protein